MTRTGKSASGAVWLGRVARLATQNTLFGPQLDVEHSSYVEIVESAELYRSAVPRMRFFVQGAANVAAQSAMCALAEQERS